MEKILLSFIKLRKKHNKVVESNFRDAIVGNSLEDRTILGEEFEEVEGFARTKREWKTRASKGTLEQKHKRRTTETKAEI